MLTSSSDEVIAHSGEPAHILVVEDEALFARATRKRLERAGHRCR